MGDNRKTGRRGLDLVKRYETLRLEAYLPTPNDVPTIGWGHTRGVQMGDTCTEAEADDWLREDLAEAERAVNGIGVPLTQGMFDALVSLVFNVGASSVDGRHVIGRELRRERYVAAWRGFALWINQAGKPLRGLARRRAEEMTLFVADGGEPRFL